MLGLDVCAITRVYLLYPDTCHRYQPAPKSEFDELLNAVYSSSTDAHKVHAHSLAVFFMIMCIGSLFDNVHPDHEIHTERYHAVARAALSSHSIVHQRSPTTVQALFLLNIYKYIIPRPSPEYRWLMSGICARCVHSAPLENQWPDFPAVWRKRWASVSVADNFPLNDRSYILL
jgi:hypothetical protein